MYGFSAPDQSLFQPLLMDPQTSECLSEPRFVACMLDVEAALAEAQADVGLAPTESAQAIRQAADALALKPEELAAGTARDGVPVPDLVKALKHAVGAPHDAWVHYGATSQDIADTAVVLLTRQLLGQYRTALQSIIAQLADLTEQHRDVLVAGRTRSQQGAPVSLGLKMARWNRPLVRQLERLGTVAADLSKVQLAGAVGNLSVLGDQAEAVAERLAERLHLSHDGGWHTQRDSLMWLGSWCATTTAMLGKMACDWMLMAQTEVGELRFRDGGGSSTMPQKSNPVKAEVIQALARHVATQTGHLFQTGQMAHERDGASWSGEWLVLPSILSHTGAALAATRQALPNIEWNRAAMERNLWQTRGLLFAETLTFLLAADRPRDDARALVMECVQKVNADGAQTLDLLSAVNAAAGTGFRADDLAEKLLHAGITDVETERSLTEAAACRS